MSAQADTEGVGASGEPGVAAAAAAALPAPRIIQSKRPRLSLVWLVPLLALAIGAGLVVRSILQTGPRIEIEFRTAEGLEAGKTEVRYKEVVIGRVQTVTLRDDRQRVVAEVQLDRSAASVAVEDTLFWVVRPRVGVGGVSGLGTLLSGAYVGVDVGKSGESRSRYVGLEVAPYVLRGEPGAVFVLRTADLGSLDVGSPIYYRRTRVGRVVGYTLDAGTDELQVKVFIEAPYQKLVTPQTRFWNASGVDLTLDANGLTLNTQTLASLVAGGVAFAQPDVLDRSALPGAAPGGSSFALFKDRKAAMAPDNGLPMPVRMLFDGSLRGLVAGAPIDFLGVEVGHVRSAALHQDAQGERYEVEVLADLYPTRLDGLRHPAGKSAKAAKPGLNANQALLQRLLDKGLRAQLRTGNLLTGQLYVALDFNPKAKPMPLLVQGGVATLPTQPGTLSELQAQVGEIVGKVSKLPLDEIARGLADTLRQAETTMKDLTPEARQALAETQRTLVSTQQTLLATQQTLSQVGPQAQNTLVELQRTLASTQKAIERLDSSLLDDRAPVQRELAQTLADVQRAANTLRVLGEQLQRQPESLLRGAPADPPLPESRR